MLLTLRNRPLSPCRTLRSLYRNACSAESVVRVDGNMYLEGSVSTGFKTFKAVGAWLVPYVAKRRLLPLKRTLILRSMALKNERTERRAGIGASGDPIPVTDLYVWCVHRHGLLFRVPQVAVVMRKFGAAISMLPVCESIQLFLCACTGIIILEPPQATVFRLHCNHSHRPSEPRDPASGRIATTVIEVIVADIAGRGLLRDLCRKGSFVKTDRISDAGPYGTSSVRSFPGRFRVDPSRSRSVRPFRLRQIPRCHKRGIAKHTEG
jgi:hypothetical protein